MLSHIILANVEHPGGFVGDWQSKVTAILLINPFGVEARIGGYNELGGKGEKKN